MAWIRLFLGAGLVALAPALAAQSDPHAAQPERPTVATHSGTVAPGWLELETGVEYDRLSDHTTAVVPTLLKLGLRKGWQLSLQIPLAAPDRFGIGLGDVSAGLKARVGGHFAILPSLKLPTGSEPSGRGTGTTDASLLVIWSQPLGRVGMDLNAGATFRTGDGSKAPRTATLWTASFGGPVGGPVGWVLECFGYPATTGPAGSASTIALLGGPTYRVKPWLVLDAGGIVRLAGPQPNALYAGLTWNLGRYLPQGRRRSPSPLSRLPAPNIEGLRTRSGR